MLSIDDNRGVGEASFLEAKGVSKAFGGVSALRGVSVAFSSGTVHGLVGANGAGKSTLIKILVGAERADEGEVLIDGAPVNLTSPRHAHHLGIHCIHQELNLVPNFSAYQNLALEYDQASRLGFLTDANVEKRSKHVMAALGADFRLDLDVEQLSVTQRWLVALGQGLMADSRIIVMDEPSTAFTHSEVERLFRVIDGLRDRGVAVVYVSHRLDEIQEICDEVTVMRDGAVVDRLASSELSRERLVVSIVGQSVEPAREVALAHDRHGPEADRNEVFAADNLTRSPLVHGVSFAVGSGELVGLAGLVGSGRTELARVIAGADRPDKGRMTVDGRDYHPRSPRVALSQGVAMVPEERRTQGLVLLESVAFNATLSTLDSYRRRFISVLNVKSMGSRIEEQIADFGIRARSPRQVVVELSGGNQQKVVVSRLVQTRPKLIVMDEPTVGMDVNARRDLYEIIVSLADSGAGVLMISSDFEELELCSRVLIMRDGKISRELSGTDVTKDRITHYCYSEDEVR